MNIEIKDNKVTIEAETESTTAAFFRVFDEGRMIYYASSRLGTVEVTPSGFIIRVPEDFSNCDYELKTYPGMKLAAAGKLTNRDITSKDDFKEVVKVLSD